MSKPWIHAKSSARRWGGTPDDYIAIHEKILTVTDFGVPIVATSVWWVADRRKSFIS